MFQNETKLVVNSVKSEYAPNWDSFSKNFEILSWESPELNWMLLFSLFFLIIYFARKSRKCTKRIVNLYNRNLKTKRKILSLSAKNRFLFRNNRMLKEQIKTLKVILLNTRDENRTLTKTRKEIESLLQKKESSYRNITEVVKTGTQKIIEFLNLIPERPVLSDMTRLRELLNEVKQLYIDKLKESEQTISLRRRKTVLYPSDEENSSDSDYNPNE